METTTELIPGLAAKLRQARLDKKLTLAEAGAVCGVTLQAIARYEAGGAIPSLPVAFRLAGLYGLSLDAIGGLKAGRKR